MNGKSSTQAKKEKAPLSFDILMIGVISLLAVGSWVIFDVYRSFTVTTVPKVLQKQIRPLNSKLDPDLLSDIRARRQFSDLQLNSVTPKAYIPPEERDQPTPSVTAVPSQQLVSPTPATSSATPTPSPQATQSGQITL